MTGKPFHTASDALPTHMLAQRCDLDVGEDFEVLGDPHRPAIMAPVAA